MPNSQGDFKTLPLLSVHPSSLVGHATKSSCSRSQFLALSPRSWEFTKTCLHHILEIPSGMSADQPILRHYPAWFLSFRLHCPLLLKVQCLENSCACVLCVIWGALGSSGKNASLTGFWRTIQHLPHSAAKCGCPTESGADTGVVRGSVLLASLCKHP